jgi:hypothetical protein
MLTSRHDTVMDSLAKSLLARVISSINLRVLLTYRRHLARGDAVTLDALHVVPPSVLVAFGILTDPAPQLLQPSRHSA